ncbi:MAG: glycosyltransferase family 39 protein [Blastocatellia bacterium]
MTFRRNLDVLLVFLVIAGFVFVAADRLATVPVYETDESYTLQVPYEILNRGKLALPMYRYLGGNIENVWHSLTPVFFLILSGFLKVFGFGVLQGRVFNLITVVLTLWMVFLIGRRLFTWPAGLIAVLLIISDQTVLERSRLLRNDYAAEALALLAFYLYDVAEQRKSSRFYVASGLAAGAGVMCHSSILYMIGAICILMLLREGWRVFASKKLYQFALSAFLVMSYEIVYDLIDYNNFLTQYRGDDLHFGVFSPSGWWSNLLDEPIRYTRWYNAYDVTFQNVPRTLIHLFQFLTAIAVVYLIVRFARHIKRGNSLSDPRVRLLVVTVVMAVFFANIAHKAGYYNAHFVTWFGLCVGVMVSDGLNLIAKLRTKQSREATLLYRAAVASVVVAVVAYAALLGRQQVRYLREVRNPALASFEEIKSALRDLVPDELCPVAVKAPVIWLAFPEKDQCFATIERRMAASVDIDGKAYALLVRPKNPDYWARDLDQQHPLLGELTDTPYGNFLVYYTGLDTGYATEPKRYHFFRRWRGYVTGQQIATAREVWFATLDRNYSADSANTLMTSDGLSIGLPRVGATGSGIAELFSIDLKPSTAYQLVLESESPDEWEAVVMEEITGTWLKKVEISADGPRENIKELFRTLGGRRIRIGVRALAGKSPESVPFTRISIREVSEL